MAADDVFEALLLVGVELEGLGLEVVGGGNGRSEKRVRRILDDLVGGSGLGDDFSLNFSSGPDRHLLISVTTYRRRSH